MVQHLLSQKGLVKYKYFSERAPFELNKRHLLLISAFILVLSQDLHAEANPKNQFSIVYTNDVMGEVEPCG